MGGDSRVCQKTNWGGKCQLRDKTTVRLGMDREPTAQSIGVHRSHRPLRCWVLWRMRAQRPLCCGMSWCMRAGQIASLNLLPGTLDCYRNEKQIREFGGETTGTEADHKGRRWNIKHNPRSVRQTSFRLQNIQTLSREKKVHKAETAFACQYPSL